MLAVVPDHLPNSLVVARTLWAWVQWVQQVLRVEASWPLRPLPLLTLVPVVDLASVVVPVGYWYEQACLIALVLLVIWVLLLLLMAVVPHWEFVVAAEEGWLGRNLRRLKAHLRQIRLCFL